MTPPRWQRFLLVQTLQSPAVLLLIFGSGTAVPWVAGLWGSIVCCAGTDSAWRWINRLLVLQAIAWLCLATVWPSS